MHARSLKTVLFVTLAVELWASTPWSSAQSIPSNASSGSNNKPVSWPSGSVVYVYIDTSTIPAGSNLYNTINQRMTNSNNIAGSGVQYVVSDCSATSLCSYGQLTQYFNSGPVTGGDVGQNAQTWDNSPTTAPNQPEISSTVTIDSSQLNTTAGVYSTNYATRVVSHETMHDYGDGDDPDADPNSTLMSYQASPDNPYIYLPSNDDLSSASYWMGGGGGGCGGECGCNVCYEPPPED